MGKNIINENKNIKILSLFDILIFDKIIKATNKKEIYKIFLHTQDYQKT